MWWLNRLEVARTDPQSSRNDRLHPLYHPILAKYYSNYLADSAIEDNYDCRSLTTSLLEGLFIALTLRKLLFHLLLPFLCVLCFLIGHRLIPLWRVFGIRVLGLCFNLILNISIVDCRIIVLIVKMSCSATWKLALIIIRLFLFLIIIVFFVFISSFFLCNFLLLIIKEALIFLTFLFFSNWV